MPAFLTLACPTCGGKLQITSDIERFACAHCGNEHIVRRTGGTISIAPIVAGLDGIKSGVDRTAAELAIRRLKEEIREIPNPEAINLVVNGAAKEIYERRCNRRKFANSYKRVFNAKGSLGEWLLGMSPDRVVDVLNSASTEDLGHLVVAMSSDQSPEADQIRMALTFIAQCRTVPARLRERQELLARYQALVDRPPPT